MSSAPLVMQPSGQKIQHNRQRVHFFVSITGRKVLQNPVCPMLATLGEERGVIGKSFMLLGSLTTVITTLTARDGEV